MKKISTIFERDWDGNKAVLPMFKKGIDSLFLSNFCVPTEKIDGMNIRLTIRNRMVVRVEKRLNPTKLQKAKGIEDPWYTDAGEFQPEDKHIFAAVNGRKYDDVPDGEWSGEAIGPNIQGNPLNLERPTVYLFSIPKECVLLKDAPSTFDELKAWLQTRKSGFGNGLIEGVVWHGPDGAMYKIKRKDFK